MGGDVDNIHFIGGYAQDDKGRFLIEAGL